MRLAVTGASSFLGRRILSHALGAGHAVRALVGPGRAPPPPHPALALVPGDLEDPHALDALTDGADALLHLAAFGSRPVHPDDRRRVNALAPVMLVESAIRGGIGRMVVAGTCLEYAGHGRLPALPAPPDAPPLGEDAPLESGDGLGAARASGGIVLRAVARQRGLPCWYLRLATLMGEGDGGDGGLLPAVLGAAAAGRAFETTGGEQVREWLHVDDAAEAVLRAAARAPPGGGIAVVNVGTGQGVALRDVVRRAFEVAGARATLVRVGGRPYRRGEVHRLVMDVERARALLGFTARRPLEDGLAGIAAEARRQRPVVARA
jgi:dTDP-6-deoxy-L-talose 4-dehydrogenase (NAD+)